MIKKIVKCRLCSKKNLDLIIDFNKIPIGNNYQKKLSKAIKAKTYNLCLNRCKHCGHFQLGHIVDKKILYATNYTYLSGVTKTFLNHFELYSKFIIKKIKLKQKSLVLDIGSNDGSCLKYFKKLKMQTLGIDPAKKPSEIANKNGILTINSFFDYKSVSLILNKFGKVDFITSHNVFAHVENFQELIKNTKYVLKNNGYLCFEIGYFKEVLKNNYFDTIYHEHIDYHHANPLTLFLNSVGYSVIHISVNKIQGGSIRILCKNDNLGINSAMANRFIEKERKSVYFGKLYLRNWHKKIYSDMRYLNEIIEKNLKLSKKFIAYGAPTKASLLLKILKLSKNEIQFVVEDNKLKINRFLPNIGIPIKSTKSIIEYQPKLILILAWNFKDEIIKNLKKMLKYNTTVIIPLPKLKVVKIKNV